MGHIVFAAPPIASFHLHERLRRDLVRRGHRVSVLCAERHAFSFWRAQLADVTLLQPKRGPAAALPDEVFRHAEDRRERRAAAALADDAGRSFGERPPDLVLLHQRRSATASMLHFVARAAGSRVLWSGRGLLPHTTQLDERGLDGDAGSRRLSAADYRVVQPERAMLDASLAHALGGSAPATLPRTPVVVPTAARRAADALASLLAGDGGGVQRAWNGWAAALGPAAPSIQRVPRIDLRPPFVAVLLQRPQDPLLRCDAPDAPGAEALLRRALEAARAFGDDAEVVAVLPAGAAPTHAGLHRLPRALRDRVRLATDAMAAVVAAAAAATVTVNHPAAFVSLLAGTPVVLLGRALYELPGVTTPGTLVTLPDDLRAATTVDRPALRRRLLTWHLRHGHVWCSTEQPNHNGVLGLAEAIERRLLPANGDPQAAAMTYRPGPSWPLATS